MTAAFRAEHYADTATTTLPSAAAISSPPESPDISPRFSRAIYHDTLMPPPMITKEANRQTAAFSL
jgi:hypothetical protein